MYGSELTIRDLREMLDEVDDEDALVRLMSQPSWPFEYDLRPTLFDPSTSVGTPEWCDRCGGPVEMVELEIHHSEDGRDESCGEPIWDEEAYPPSEFEPHAAVGRRVVYLLEGTQLGYGSRRAWDEA